MYSNLLIYLDLENLNICNDWSGCVLSTRDSIIKPSPHGLLINIYNAFANDLTASILEDEVRSAIEAWEGRAEVLEIVVTPEDENNRYRVAVTFRIINQIEEQTLEVFLQRER